MQQLQMRVLPSLPHWTVYVYPGQSEDTLRPGRSLHHVSLYHSEQMHVSEREDVLKSHLPLASSPSITEQSPGGLIRQIAPGKPIPGAYLDLRWCAHLVGGDWPIRNYTYRSCLVLLW